MMISVEGCDKTGKSQLSKKLAEKFGAEWIHYSKPDKHPLEYFGGAFEKENVVLDRFILGEKVYAKVKKHASDWTDEEYASYLKKMEDRGAILLVLWDYADKLKARCVEEKETYITPDEAVKVQNLFLKEAKRIAAAYPKLTVFKVRAFSNHWSLL